MEKQYGTTNGHSKWTHLIYGKADRTSHLPAGGKACSACRHQGHAGQAEHAPSGTGKTFSGQGWSLGTRLWPS